METTSPPSGAYVTLDDLIQIQFQARGFNFLSRQPLKSLLSGRHASRLRGRGLDFEELRQYLPGDDPRTIDWKATRRSGKAQVRVFTEEKERTCLLVIDQRLSMFFGTKVDMKSVTAARFASLAAWRMLSSQDRAGAIVFNDSHLVHVKPQRSRKTVMHILKTICDFNTHLGANKGIVSEKAMLDQALEKASRTSTHDHIICIISDFNGTSDRTHGLVRNMARHNDVILFFVYDPIAKELPDKGSLIISDGDQQLMIDSTIKSLQEKVPDILLSRYRLLKERLEAFRVPVLPITTDQDVALQTRQLLGNQKIEL